jgi:hypothetical protein
MLGLDQIQDQELYNAQADEDVGLNGSFNGDMFNNSFEKSDTSGKKPFFGQFESEINNMDEDLDFMN